MNGLEPILIKTSNENQVVTFVHVLSESNGFANKDVRETSAQGK